METRKILDKTIKDAQKVIDQAKKDLANLEVFYSIGDRFEMNGNKYILVEGESGQVTLSRLADGSRWRSPVPVVLVNRITLDEWYHIACGEYLESLTRYWNAQKGCEE